MKHSVRILLLFLLLSPLHAAVNDNNDTGIWLEEHLRATLPSKWFFFFKAQQEWGNHFKTFWNYQFDGVLLKDITSSFPSTRQVLLGPGYNETGRIQTIHGVRKWVHYSRPSLQTFITVPFHHWDIFQRLRLEYEIPDNHFFKPYVLFRYQVRISPPWFWTRFRINPYLFNEWFFRKDTYREQTDRGYIGRWFQNRFRLGMNMNLIQNKLDAGMYLQWRAQKQKPQTKPLWFNNYQLGLTLTYIL